MAANISPKLSILGKTALAGGLVGSGSGIASLLRGENLKYEKLDKAVDLAQDGEFESHKYTALTVYRDKSLFQEEGSYWKKLEGQERSCWLGFLEDHIHGTKDAEFIYYIKKADNKKVFVSPEKPKKANEGIYMGWSLNEFKWKQDEKKWYGYCFVGETEEDMEKCDNLPEGWTKWEIAI